MCFVSLITAISLSCLTLLVADSESKDEGGLVNDPDDLGGLTNLGVTQTTLDEYRRQFGEVPSSVRQLTQDQAIKIYKRLYWKPASCNFMPTKLAIAHFDWSVHHGVDGAVRDLQECLGKISVDGSFGANTAKRLEEILQTQGEDSLLQAYLSKRRYFYKNGRLKFRQGWLNRLNDLEKYLAVATVFNPKQTLVSATQTAVEFDSLNTYKYWQEQSHQIEAVRYLWEQAQLPVKEQFITIWHTVETLSKEKFNYKARVDTIIKLEPVDSSHLEAEQIARIKAGTELTCITHDRALNNHIKITLEGATIKGQRQWYLYQPDWESTESLPENDEKIASADHYGDRQIQVPGITNPVYLNAPITDDTPHFYWYEATHNGERIPQTHIHTLNIIKIARLAEQVRKKLGQPLKITSWYRPEPWNSKAGGAKNSTHLQGLAIDFNCGDMSGREMAHRLNDWS